MCSSLPPSVSLTTLTSWQVYNGSPVALHVRGSHSVLGQPVLTADPEDLYDEAHWTDQGQVVKSSGGPNSTAPTEGVPQAALRLQNVPRGKILSLDQAIHFSIDCACQSQYVQHVPLVPHFPLFQTFARCIIYILIYLQLKLIYTMH